MYAAKIILDSINEVGNRLTTFEVTYPRFVHSEFMTHRLFSRNAASSRAIPNEKLRQRISEDAVMPVYWGQNQSGMQAEIELDSEAQGLALKVWLKARDEMLLASEHLAKLGVHKQICNRLMEPWMWITVIVTATEYENFFHLRCHPDAQPEIQKIANMMRDLYRTNSPRLLKTGMWHTPYIQPNEELSHLQELDVSVARCARVSYLTHDGKREIEADLKLFDRLQSSGHWSPFEHVARATPVVQSGNFSGWKQYRKYFPNEHWGGELV